MKTVEHYKTLIRDVPDFPKKGIVFKDITPLLADAEALQTALRDMEAPYADKHIDKVAAIESRGFIFGSALAQNLGVGFVPVRKKGKLPYKTRSATYSLEYGTDTLEVHADAFEPGEKVLVVDDVLATGGTARAVGELISEANAHVAGFVFLIELKFLNGAQKISQWPVNALIQYT